MGSFSACWTVEPSAMFSAMATGMRTSVRVAEIGIPTSLTGLPRGPGPDRAFDTKRVWLSWRDVLLLNWLQHEATKNTKDARRGWRPSSIVWSYELVRRGQSGVDEAGRWVELRAGLVGPPHPSGRRGVRTNSFVRSPCSSWLRAAPHSDQTNNASLHESSTLPNSASMI